MGKAEDAVTIFQALQRIDEMGQEVTIGDLFKDKGVTLKDVPSHVFLTALAERVAKYQTEGISNEVEFVGTKTAIENKLAKGATAAERIILEKLLSALKQLEQS